MFESIKSLSPSFLTFAKSAIYSTAELSTSSSGLYALNQLNFSLIEGANYFRLTGDRAFKVMESSANWLDIYDGVVGVTTDISSLVRLEWLKPIKEGNVLVIVKSLIRTIGVNLPATLMLIKKYNPETLGSISQSLGQAASVSAIALNLIDMIHAIGRYFKLVNSDSFDDTQESLQFLKSASEIGFHAINLAGSNLPLVRIACAVTPVIITIGLTFHTNSTQTEDQKRNDKKTECLLDSAEGLAGFAKFGATIAHNIALQIADKPNLESHHKGLIAFRNDLKFIDQCISWRSIAEKITFFHKDFEAEKNLLEKVKNTFSLFNSVCSAVEGLEEHGINLGTGFLPFKPLSEKLSLGSSSISAVVNANKFWYQETEKAKNASGKVKNALGFVKDVGVTLIQLTKKNENFVRTTPFRVLSVFTATVALSKGIYALYTR